MPFLSPLAAIRWLPLVNSTSGAIPAFACLRLTGSTLDATGQVIFTVGQPNGDPAAAYLFNGPCAMAPGANGSGTLDFPAQAAWDTGSPAVGEAWGPKSGQWTLSKGTAPGFPALGIVDSLTQRMMVGSPSPTCTTIVKPSYDIAPITGSTPGSGSGEVYRFDGTTLSDSGAAVTVFNLGTRAARAGVFYECIYIDGCAFIVDAASVTLFEGTIYGANLTSSSATGEVTPTKAVWGGLPADSPITANNDIKLSGPVGQTAYVAQGDDGNFYFVNTRPPTTAGGGCTFTLTASFSGGSASATVGTSWGSAPDGAGDAITVNDLSAVYGRSLAGAKGEATYDSTAGYLVTLCDQETLKYRGQLGGTLMHGTGSVAVGSLQAMNSFPFGQATSESTITAKNVMSLGGSAGAACYVDWNQAASQWELSMVAPTPQQVVCRERLTTDGSNNLQYTVREILGWFDDTAESIYLTIPGWTTTNVTAVVGERFSSGALQYQTQTHAAIGTVGAASGWTTLFSTVNVTGVTDLQYAGYPTHAFQDKTANFTAIDPSYGGAGAVTESGWASWATMVEADPITTVALSGAGVLSDKTTPVWVPEVGTETLPETAGSLTTTTHTAVTEVDYSGGVLSYQTATFTILGVSDDSGPIDLFSTGNVTAYTTLSAGTGSTPTLAGKKTTFTAINPGSEGSLADWYTPSSVTAVTSVTWDGTNLKDVLTPLFVFGSTSGSTSTILTGTNCGSG